MQRAVRNKRTIAILTFSVAVLSVVPTLAGIFSHNGEGTFEYRSIRGKDVIIFGLGIYRHMSAEVAIQGIAQDYVTLFLGVPLLLFSLYFSLKGSLRGRYVLLGSLGYFFVTYLFYLVMAMYNEYFLAYTALTGLSFFSLVLTGFSFDLRKLAQWFPPSAPTDFAGGFLIFNSLCIALLWLSVIMPPLLGGSIYPGALDHYTTLIVQGLDLGLLLPLGVISGYLLMKRTRFGLLLGPAYLVFLSLLMLALVGKIIYQGLMGYNIIPVIFIIPVLCLVALACAFLLLKNLNDRIYLI